MDLLPMPITLVVKAPNQKIADQTVECELDWTIRKLKNHLSMVYPNSPKEHQQKIIYSGKLLSDNVQLKDVLKQYEPNQRTHTVHLVCSSSLDSNSSTASSTTQSLSSDSMDATEGIRRRRPVTTASSNHSNVSNSADSEGQVTESASISQSHSDGGANTTQTSQHNPADNTQAFNGAGQFFNPVTSMGMMAPQAAMIPGFPYSPEQMLWFQQMYAQQMAQYMQYYQGAPHQNSFDHTAGVQNVAAAPAAAAVNQQAAPERDQPMVMNAAGDAVMDDDEENGNRDWLDWMYTISRFIVLISIVYFYSTFSRFMLVVGSFVILYLYQQGWFQIQRDVRNVRVQEHQQEEVQNEENAPEADRGLEDDSASDDPDGATTNSEATALPAAPAGPGYLRIAFSFVLTFFTSLIPQPPAPVNVN